MANKYLVGIDVGTTGTKTIIFDCEGQIVSVGYTEYACHYPQPNWVEQDAEELIEAVFETMRQALKNGGIDPSEIASIAASKIGDQRVKSFLGAIPATSRIIPSIEK